MNSNNTSTTIEITGEARNILASMKEKTSIPFKHLVSNLIIKIPEDQWLSLIMTNNSSDNKP